MDSQNSSVKPEQEGKSPGKVPAVSSPRRAKGERVLILVGESSAEDGVGMVNHRLRPRSAGSIGELPCFSYRTPKASLNANIKTKSMTRHA